ncbi:uncharacterized protein LOC111817975 [Octodon degus]|uniref:Uncharacterized protein LOC111817975 n=1 Tax=Octodon degus TaxID=10160 RepID=A0A6P6EVD8_OCTDE|nr:uncharacterized protein LOC111817975 [Octodon degus]
MCEWQGPWRPKVERPAPAPARARPLWTAAPPAGTTGLCAPIESRAPTGRGGWCERLGQLPARRGWNTMSQAGGREREQPDSAAGRPREACCPALDRLPPPPCAAAAASHGPEQDCPGGRGRLMPWPPAMSVRCPEGRPVPGECASQAGRGAVPCQVPGRPWQAHLMAPLAHCVTRDAEMDTYLDLSHIPPSPPSYTCCHWPAFTKSSGGRSLCCLLHPPLA